MKSRWLLSMMLTGMAALVGCQSNHAIVRGQNPAANPPGMQTPMGPIPGPMGPMPGPMYYDGPSGANSMSCPPNQCPPEWAMHPNSSPENYWRPKHHATYDYKQPKGLTYPPQNQPAAVVQYPYYTCKGPSDFFMK